MQSYCCEEGDYPNLASDGLIILEDWLTIMNECKLCYKKGCPECLCVCYSCANTSDLNNPIAICDICLKNNNIIITCVCDCGWLSCQEHPDEKCGQCYANKCYEQRHS